MNAYYYYLRSGYYDQIGSEHRRWAFSDKYRTKKDLHKAMNKGMQTVRRQEILTGKQLIERLGADGAESAIREILKYQPELTGKEGTYDTRKIIRQRNYARLNVHGPTR